MSDIRTALEALKRVLGPSAPECQGCAVEIKEALRIIDATLATPPESARHPGVEFTFDDPPESAPASGAVGMQEHFDELRATLKGAHSIMETVSSLERRVGPVGSHARGYTHKITKALRHLDAIESASGKPGSGAVPVASVVDLCQELLLGFFDQYGQSAGDELETYRAEIEDRILATAAQPAAHPVAQAAGGGEVAEWVVLGPDGSRFTAPTPMKAAVLANRHRVQVDPVAAKQFHDAIEGIRQEGEEERLRCMAEHGTLDCPACGGSGHIGDVKDVPAARLLATPQPQPEAAPVPAVVGALSDERIEKEFWSAFRGDERAVEVLTHTQWKDGIDIDVLSPSIKRFARALLASPNAQTGKPLTAPEEAK